MPEKRRLAFRRAAICCAPLFLFVTAPARAQMPAAAEASALPPGVVPNLPPSVVPPHRSAFAPCRFPRAAMEERPARPTILHFTVTRAGRVTDVKIAQSSDSPSADEAARECVRDWLYTPALRRGEPVDVPWGAVIAMIIDLHRPTSPSADAPPGYTAMPVPKNYFLAGGGCEKWHQDHSRGVLVAFDVEPDGSVKNAVVAQSSGDPAIDKDAADCVSRRNYKPATRNGQPVEIRLTAELYGGGG